MERKSEPNRAKICIVIAIFGGMLSILYVLIRHYVFIKKLNNPKYLTLILESISD